MSVPAVATTLPTYYPAWPKQETDLDWLDLDVYSSPRELRKVREKIIKSATEEKKKIDGKDIDKVEFK